MKGLTGVTVTSTSNFGYAVGQGDNSAGFAESFFDALPLPVFPTCTTTGLSVRELEEKAKEDLAKKNAKDASRVSLFKAIVGEEDEEIQELQD